MVNRIPFLSPRQAALIRSAAALLPPARRESFVRSVAARLAGRPSDFAVTVAINYALDLVPNGEG
jgi:hypothetical protein